MSYLILDMLCSFILLYVIKNIVKKIIMKYGIENGVLSIYVGFQNANENVFHGFGDSIIYLWKLYGKILEMF